MIEINSVSSCVIFISNFKIKIMIHVYTFTTVTCRIQLNTPVRHSSQGISNFTFSRNVLLFTNTVNFDRQSIKYHRKSLNFHKRFAYFRGVCRKSRVFAKISTFVKKITRPIGVRPISLPTRDGSPP